MTIGKNRPSWRLPLVEHNQQATFRGYQSRFGDGHPSRVQCRAVARTTGERCRRDALRGAACCQAHGGHRQAYRNAPEGFRSAITARATVRGALAKLSTIERYPPGEPYRASPIDRGYAIEEARNRHLGLTVVSGPKR